MKWLKQQHIYVPDGTLSWAKQYASVPTPYFINDHIIRLFVASCDENTKMGRIGYVDVNANNPAEVLAIATQPVLDVGVPGSFDDNGVLPTSIVKISDTTLYLYYVGFQLGHKTKYFQFQGLAVSHDSGNSFKRYSQVPILERSDKELHHRTASFVMKEKDIYRAWYVAGNEWTISNGKSLPVYNLRYLESKDGIHWPGEGKICIDFKNEDEHAVGRPWIIKQNGLYKMFFSSRTKSKDYRIGYAESQDGIHWIRKDDEIGIDVSATGWDSAMICYASVLSYKDKTYMFYNGNNCGQTGFGYAVLEE